MRLQFGIPLSYITFLRDQKVSRLEDNQERETRTVRRAGNLVMRDSEGLKACFQHKGRDDSGTHLAYNPTGRQVQLLPAFFQMTQHTHGAYATYLIKVCGPKGAETTWTTCPLHHSEATTCLPAPS